MAGHTLDERKQKHIEELDSLLAEYKKEMADLKKSISVSHNHQGTVVSDVFSPQMSQKISDYQNGKILC